MNEQQTPEGVSRRGVLRGMGVGAAAVAGLTGTPASTRAETPFRGPGRGDGGFWKKVRREFILDKDALYLNIGTVGSPPKGVLHTLDSTAKQLARVPDAGYSDFPEIRKVIGAGVGAAVDEIAISDSTSDGMAKVIAGLPFAAGDEVLTTNHEHSGGNSPLAILRDRHDVDVVRVTLPVGDDQLAEDYVRLFERKITSRTKLIMFSAPVYLTGTMLPIRLLSELAQEHGIPTLVDVAHVPGMMHYDFGELGIDFAAGAGAKWQCGPAGSGLLYVRNRVTEANPNPLAEFWPVVSSGYEEDMGPRTAVGPGSYDIGAVLQECGNRQEAIYQGYRAANEMWDEIGRDRIEEYVVGLGTALKEQVVERWGREALYSPLSDDRLRCALTAFNPFQRVEDVRDEEKSDALVERLEDEHGIVVRNTSTPTPDGQTHHPIRVSTHLFHNSDDVDRAIRAIWKVSKKMS